jgi:hypothetical protein
MARVRPGATLTPHFRDFLPGWVARQPWYPGTGVPTLRAVGFFRFEDPDGRVGVETHLVTDGSSLYQLPLTYRDAPLPDAAAALVATAEHSVLGTRWIYDAEADPVWVRELLRVVGTDGASDPGGNRGAEARGHRLVPGELTAGTVAIELRRVLTGELPTGPAVAGLLTGTWYPDGPAGAAATGCLAVVRELGGAVDA